MKKRYPRSMMATALIPWDCDFEFMPRVFERQVNHMIENGLRHIYLFGTAGEDYAVNSRQFAQIVRLFTDIMKSHGLSPMVGVVDMSVARIKEKLETAYSMGVREFQFSLPCWGPLNNEEVFGFFDTLLNDYPDCKFLNYNLKRTGRFLEPEELFKLAELHSNFCAVKHTRVDDSDISAISSSGTPLQFFVTEKNFLRLSEKTECGLLMSISNINLDLARDFYEACVKRDFVAAGKIMDIFWEARSAMIDSVEFRAIDGVYDKLYTKYNISEFPLRLLPPYQCASEEVFKKFKYKSDQLINSIQI